MAFGRYRTKKHNIRSPTVSELQFVGSRNYHLYQSYMMYMYIILVLFISISCVCPVAWTNSMMFDFLLSSLGGPKQPVARLHHVSRLQPLDFRSSGNLKFAAQEKRWTTVCSTRFVVSGDLNQTLWWIPRFYPENNMFIVTKSGARFRPKNASSTTPPRAKSRRTFDAGAEELRAGGGAVRHPRAEEQGSNQRLRRVGTRDKWRPDMLETKNGMKMYYPGKHKIT